MVERSIFKMMEEEEGVVVIDRLRV